MFWLNGHADEGGINGWPAATMAGMSNHDISFSFVNSAGAWQSYGEMSDERFVSMLYQTARNREADARTYPPLDRGRLKSRP